MRAEILTEMRLLVDEYVDVDDLRELLHVFIQEKAEEQSNWANITEYCHRMLGGTSPQICRIGAIAELVMLGLDIVDDLQDKDNKTKPWMLCPAELALNAVLALLFAPLRELSLQQGIQAPGTLVLAVEAERFLMRSVNGQHRDLNASVMSEADYIAMVRDKSGALMKFACHLGAASVAGIDEETLKLVEEVAECAGIVAQLGNDLRDVRRYDVKNDLIHKKRTLPILYLLEDTEGEFSTIRRYYAGELTQEQFLKVKQESLRYIDDSGCVEYVMTVQALFQDRAESLFSRLPAASPWKEQFREITFG